MNNDLISRKALKKALDNYRMCHCDNCTDIDCVNCLYELIDNAPTVEPKQGEWIFDKENSFTFDMFKCSICGYFGHTHFKFCPDCGAYMQKGGAE